MNLKEEGYCRRDGSCLKGLGRARKGLEWEPCKKIHLDKGACITVVHNSHDLIVQPTRSKTQSDGSLLGLIIFWISKYDLLAKHFIILTPENKAITLRGFKPVSNISPLKYFYRM